MKKPNTNTPTGTPPGAASAGSGQTPARRFLVQFKMTACEEYSAPTPAAALSDAENDDAPPLGDFTASEGPEIVAEWDHVAEDWRDTPAPSGTLPGAASAGSGQETAEVLRILASCLSQAFESNHEWRRFAAKGQERADQEAELAELNKAQDWLDSTDREDASK